MASFSFVVDTGPMAQSVDTVRRHVNGVTTAVTSMAEAVVAAEHKASEEICDNVDTGFYLMIKSQISQKAIAAYSEMLSKQSALVQMSKALENIKFQMETDFHRISSRYGRLFKSIDKELETRVRELDRPAMKLAEIKDDLVFDQLKNSAAMLLSASNEEIAVSQTAVNGKLKRKTKDAMDTIARSAAEDQAYTSSVESILSDEPLGAESGSEAKNLQYLPAVYSAAESLLKSGEAVENVYTPQTAVWQNNSPLVSAINTMQGTFTWNRVPETEKEAVRKEYLALVEKEHSEDRIANELIRLFDASPWEVASAGGAT